MSYNESLRANSNYPLMSQSDWDNAPFTQPSEQIEEIEATVSLTLSKSIKIKMDVRKRERGYYSNYDLQEAAREQLNFSDINLNEWDIDDFEVAEN